MPGQRQGGEIVSLVSVWRSGGGLGLRVCDCRFRGLSRGDHRIIDGLGLAGPDVHPIVVGDLQQGRAVPSHAEAHGESRAQSRCRADDRAQDFGRLGRLRRGLSTRAAVAGLALTREILACRISGARNCPRSDKGGTSGAMALPASGARAPNCAGWGRRDRCRCGPARGPWRQMRRACVRIFACGMDGGFSYPDCGWTSGSSPQDGTCLLESRECSRCFADQMRPRATTTQRAVMLSPLGPPDAFPGQSGGNCPFYQGSCAIPGPALMPV
jgi:hypothetical protein